MIELGRSFGQGYMMRWGYSLMTIYGTQAKQRHDDFVDCLHTTQMHKPSIHLESQGGVCGLVICRRNMLKELNAITTMEFTAIALDGCTTKRVTISFQA